MKILQILTFACILVLVACNNQDLPQTAQKDTSDIVMLSSESSQSKGHSSASSIAQNYLNNQSEDVQSYKTIQIDDKLFVAFIATPLKQAIEQQIEEKIKKDLQAKTNLKDIEVSSDQKLYIELTKLENQQLSKEKAIKKMKELKKLSKEQT
ncbi:hypothetical protein SH601_02560 [Gracilibacillus sp. S3-1-1]|uniref:Uncharacterized protein n=1 Tax=Gracilibacillus pellucidus TaxID=3095368 RepID=A0ACC6M1P1_9BACI|nr:hypothetical protein [Gracilibacillus sp. S3-1-1]MDX8044857.1 hypothetical protein [Gracilibacillus sp. S3-1-1]